MREYPDQPQQATSTTDAREVIEDVLGEDLPECETNEWFIESVNFANMIDKIVEKLGW